MDIVIIIAVVFLGLALIFVEFFVLPGTTLVGILGGIVVTGGVVYAYIIDETNTTGHITLAASLVVTLILLYLGFRAYQSKRYSLKESIDSKVTLLEEGRINIGDKGVTVSVLRPNGKAKINNEKFEVYSTQGYIDSGVDVEVSKVDRNKIYVRPAET